MSLHIRRLSQQRVSPTLTSKPSKDSFSSSLEMTEQLLNIQESIQSLRRDVFAEIKSLASKLDNITHNLPIVSSSVTTGPTTRSKRSAATSEPSIANEQVENPDTKPAHHLSPSLKEENNLPKYLLFKTYIPEGWFFLCHAELVFSAMRFYDSPQTIDFLCDAVEELSILDFNMSVMPVDMDASWRRKIQQTVETFPSIVHSDDRLVSLTEYGMDAFTSIGINLGTEEGVGFTKICPGLDIECPPRKLPPGFEFLTAQELEDKYAKTISNLVIRRPRKKSATSTVAKKRPRRS
ncbi:hypothetical protein P9112_002296 [Eukaryota sp. TZLM1-RC]